MVFENFWGQQIQNTYFAIGVIVIVVILIIWWKLATDGVFGSGSDDQFKRMGGAV